MTIFHLQQARTDLAGFALCSRASLRDRRQKRREGELNERARKKRAFSSALARFTPSPSPSDACHAGYSRVNSRAWSSE